MTAAEHLAYCEAKLAQTRWYQFKKRNSLKRAIKVHKEII